MAKNRSDRRAAPIASQAGSQLPGATIRPFNIWRPSQFLGWTEQPGSHLLLPAYLDKGELTTLIGQGGIGKTRLALYLGICQILNRPWCGLATGPEPQKWLLLSDENSIARLKTDVEHMFSKLTPEEISRVDEHLRLPALLEMEDYVVWLGDAAAQARIALTVQKEAPGVVIADPLANFAPGDISKPGDMKEAIRLLISIIRRAAPKAAILLLHHARTGRQNIAQGVGWDAANFASGGKALFSSARCQINVMPGKADDDTMLVLHCAKANNCPRFETRGLIFDPETFTYAVDPGFDSAAWLAEVEGHARPGQCLCTIADVVSCVRDGHVTTKALIEHLTDAYSASKRSIERLISKALKEGGIQQFDRGKYLLGINSGKFLKK